jgi:NAD(P)-dependent dehydrogenase (short-subunit alcohol dehydrogenase family)
MRVADLTGKTVLVTGAGSGIGRETALLCARRGAALQLCDVNEAGLAETEASARKIGAAVTSRRVDVANQDEMRAFAAAVHAEVPAVDLLVNNAGVGLGATFLDTRLDDWDWIVGINLMGVVHGCHFFIPAMVERAAGGHVVNISSLAGIIANEGLTAYSTTKFAVLGLSEALRDGLRRHGIGVTAICPGLINTPITRSSRLRGAAFDTPETRQRMVEIYERRNYGPERVAENILKAVARNRAVAPVSPEAWTGYALMRIAPGFVRWLNARLAERDRRRRESSA